MTGYEGSAASVIALFATEMGPRRFFRLNRRPRVLPFAHIPDWIKQSPGLSKRLVPSSECLNSEGSGSHFIPRPLSNLSGASIREADPRMVLISMESERLDLDRERSSQS
jgi:hypothetical protein